MATVAARGLKIGTIIDKTLGVIEHNARSALLYLAAVTAISAAITYYSLAMTAPMQQLPIGLLKFLVGVVAAYLLLDAMLRKTGLRERRDVEAFYPYLGLSILYTLGVVLGFILLIIPGLLVMARWSISQPLIVARGGSVMRALGESWEQTRGNEFPILVAAFAIILPLIAVLIACSLLFEPSDLVGLVVTQLATSAMSVISLATGVAIFGLIVSRSGAASPMN